MSKTPAKAQEASSGTVADQVAEFIGRTMGELLNKKEELTRQMADVDTQIADIRNRVVSQFGEYVPSLSPRSRARKAGAGRAKGGKSARKVSEETRTKMAEAARRRWARERSKKR